MFCEAKNNAKTHCTLTGLTTFCVVHGPGRSSTCRPRDTIFAEQGTIKEKRDVSFVLAAWPTDNGLRPAFAASGAWRARGLLLVACQAGLKRSLLIGDDGEQIRRVLLDLWFCLRSA